MAVTATVERFGMTFAEAYHKLVRLNYESHDSKEISYPSLGEPTVDEEGNILASEPPVPVETWVKRMYCNYEVATYASAETREAHAEPIYRVYYSFSVSVEDADLIGQAYTHLKAQEGYEDAVDC